MSAHHAVLRVSLIFVLFLVPASLGASGMFLPVQSYDTGGMYAFSIAAADLNGDGKIDVVVANWCYTGGPCNYNEGDNAAVGVLLGNGDGTFQSPATYFSGGGEAYGVAVGDVNGDKKPDIVIANACAGVGNCASGTVGVLLGNGNGTFQPAQTFGSGGFYATGVTIGDVNGDKKPDVIVSNHCSLQTCTHGSIGVLLSNGDGTFQTAQTYDSGGESPGGMVIADVNGDGKADLLAANACDTDACDHGEAAVLFGNGNGTFQTAQVYPSGGFSAGSLALKDVNGDGKPDLVVANADPSANVHNPGVIGVLLGKGNGTFQAAQSYPSGGFGAHAVAVVDIDGDSQPDIAVANECYSANYGGVCNKGGALTVLLGNGDGTFRTASVHHAGGSASKSLVTADLDGDGRTDVITVSSCFTGGPCPYGSVGVSLNAGRFPTITALTSNPNPSVKGQSVTLTATVSSVGPNPATGKVVFRNSGAAIGSATLVGGVAVLIKKNFPVGTLSLTATYGGDTVSGKSTSPTLVQVVHPPQ
jgi:Bacterial Ig-like domain (group 3)/FG-GAP-like repeat